MISYSTELASHFHQSAADRLQIGSRVFSIQLVDGCELDDLDGLATQFTMAMNARGSEVLRLSVEDVLVKQPEPVPFLIIDGFETITDHPEIGRVLGNLRAGVMTLVEDGCKVVLMLGVDLALLTGYDGSSLLTDAKPVRMDRSVRSERAAKLEADNLNELGAGFSILTTETGLAIGCHKDGEKLHDAIRKRTRLVARGLAHETGVRLAALLEESTLLDRADTQNHIIDEPGADALWILFGVLREHYPGESVHLHRIVAEEVNSGTYCPPRYAHAFTRLWSIERLLRRTVIDSCVAERAMPASLLQGLASRLGERASRGTATQPEDAPVNPIEWLTLDELLEIIENSKFVGSEHSGFRALLPHIKSQLLPARNALVHFRGVDEAGLATIDRWHSRLVGVLSKRTASGAEHRPHPSP